MMLEILGCADVETADGLVGIFVATDGDFHGLALDPVAAVEAATAMLGAAARLTDDRFTYQAADVALATAFDAGEPVGLLQVTINGCPLALRLDAIQLAEMAVKLATVSKHIDRPVIPQRRDLR